MQRVQDFTEWVGLHRLARWIFRQRVLFEIQRGNVESIEVVEAGEEES